MVTKPPAKNADAGPDAAHPAGGSGASALVPTGGDPEGEGPVGSTARQRRVAELVATGVTNREIAAALGISVKTVEYHLANLFTTLGLHTRSALTAHWWRTNGPRPGPSRPDG